MYKIFQKCLLLIPIFGISVCAFAQQTDKAFDSQKEQIGAEKELVKRLELTLTLAENMLDQNQISDAGDFSFFALDDANQLGDKRAQAIATDLLGRVASAQGNYTSALQYFQTAQKARSDNGDQRGLAKCELNLGKLFLLQNDTIAAEKHIRSAIAQFTNESNLTGQTAAIEALGDLYARKRNLYEANTNYSSAIEMLTKGNQLAKAAQVARNQAIACAQMGDTVAAITAHKLSFSLHTSLGDKPNVARDFLAIGRLLASSNQRDEAVSQIETAQLMFTEQQDTLGVAEALLALVAVSTDKKAQLQKADDLLRIVRHSPASRAMLRAVSHEWSALGYHQEAYLAQNGAFSLNELAASSLPAAQNQKYHQRLSSASQKFTADQNTILATTSQQLRWCLFALALSFVLGLIALYKYLQNKYSQEKNHIGKLAEINQNKTQIATLVEETEELTKQLQDQIAERKLLESRVLDKDQFMTIVSKEMQQPLEQIVRATTQLANEGLKDATKHEISEMQFSASNLLVFINDMLEFNQIESGKLQLESNQFNPTLLFDQIRDRFAAQFRSRGISFQMEYDSAIPTQLSGDAIRLNQVVTKLLQFLPVHAAASSIKLQVLHGERNSIFIHIQLIISGLDTEAAKGNEPLHTQSKAEIGLDINESRAKFFNLAMVNRLVELQGGTIRFTPQEVHIALPFKHVASPLPQQPPALTQSHILTAISGKRILVVEDNKINQLVVTNLLASHGAKVIAANNGEEGVAAMHTNTFDLVLMDIQMPKIDGYRAAALIRSMSDQEKAQVPIVALTASAYLTNKEKALLFQMNDHIGKPFSPKELLQKVVGMLENQNTKQATE
jgi:CheY-like chemotaxis protein